MNNPKPKEEQIFFTPFLKDLKRYNVPFFKDDLWAAFFVALLTIPQSIAYSLLAGLPPKAGLFSAIFGAIFTAMFGSSKHLIAGPSTAVSILIQSAIADVMFNYFPNVTGLAKETLVLQILMQIVFVIGVLQLIFGFFNLGKILQFVSRSVVLGYFSAVIVAIFINQLFYLFGINMPAGAASVLMKGFYLFSHLMQINFLNFLLGFLSILLLLYLKKKFVKLPNAFIMIAISSLAAYLINLGFPKLHINDFNDLAIEENPVFQLMFPIDFSLIDKVFFPALAICMLAILEVFSVSRGIASQSGQIIRSNQEIFALGVSNSVLSFLPGAMPASGSLSRSTLNFQSGAKTRFAAVFSGILVAVIFFFLWPFAQHISLGALAALLIVMLPTLVDKEQIKLCFAATKGDGFVFALTMLCSLIFRLDVAFFIGIIISIAFYLKRASVPHLMEYAFDSSGRLKVISSKGQHRKIRIIGIAGELFFAAVDLVQNTIQKIVKDPYVEVIILRLNGVYHVDASMCLAIFKLHNYLKSTSRELLICGISDEVWQTFEKTALIDKIGIDNLFLSDETRPQLSTWKALLRAEEFISQKGAVKS